MILLFAIFFFFLHQTGRSAADSLKYNTVFVLCRKCLSTAVIFTQNNAGMEIKSPKPLKKSRRGPHTAFKNMFLVKGSVNVPCMCDDFDVGIIQI